MDVSDTRTLDPTVVLLIIAVLVMVGAAVVLNRRQGENVSSDDKKQEPAWQGPLPDPDEPELRALLNDGRLIEAIKLVRARTGMGLKEAKEYVDRFS
ncbi:ribosomal protein L7/L12 [Hyalangium gracile]|uniref:ribosomal protein L7/L12 n=1 Tax=Hyalangium gracile TaxID=394092 RepID=UPI001CCFB54A|nr:ribosomal protein L7/L12 [Hyalangium gracile]